MKKSSYKIYNRDAIEYLRSLPPESVDLVITDPPYESLEKYRKMGTTTRLKNSTQSSNQWFQIFPNSKFPELFKEIFRILKNNTHFYLFCDQETMFIVKDMAVSTGFKFWKPLVWNKNKIGMGYHYRCMYEFILFFEKGKRKLNSFSIPDILSFDRIKGNDKYPTEKPSELMEVLIQQSSDPKDIIADPFMGSGSVGVAAIKNRRKFIGNDICKDALQYFKNKLEQL
jgi:site-specific DNA-methyltransferase (adenine-specific)